MSLEVQAVLVCDGCDEKILSRAEHRSTWAQSTVWEIKREAKRLGWVEVKRGRFHTSTHWCPKCADKPTKVVSKKKQAMFRLEERE